MRKYKRKPGRVNPDRRMARAAELRDNEGLSLRQIAERLNCSHPTVLADLRRWDREHSNVTPLAVNPGGKKSPPGGEFLPPLSTTPEARDSNIIELRRKRA